MQYVQHDSVSGTTIGHGYCDNCNIVGPVFEGLAMDHHGDVSDAYICSTCAENVVSTCICCDQPATHDDWCAEHAVEWLNDNPEDIDHWLSLGGRFAAIANIALEEVV